MSQKSSKLLRWTRTGFIENEWLAFEDFDSLVMASSLRERLSSTIDHFQKSESRYHELKLAWHQGFFFFGMSGCGKSAASRAAALKMSWNHVTVPSHEILNAHLLERALNEASRVPYHVIVLEDIDLILKRMDQADFFDIFDQAVERADGILWIATTRSPEAAPKTQLCRPGRFDLSFRFDAPSASLQQELLKTLIGEARPDWAERMGNLNYAHFQELKILTARLKSQDPSQPQSIEDEVSAYIDEQMISFDRLGGQSSERMMIETRALSVDARVLTAALDVCDVFNRLIEKTVGDATEAAHNAKHD